MKTLASATVLLAVVSAYKLENTARQRRDDATTSAHSNNENLSLFPFLSKLRDNTVELFFGRHPTKETSGAGAGAAASLESLRNKYANDVVLRFNVTKSHEEQALAEASTRLFLDVWGVTKEYVDIRLHSTQVTPLLELLPTRLQSSYFTLIPDLASAIHASLPQGRLSHAREPDSASSLPGPLAAPDSVFFLKYHPLSVIVQWMKFLESIFPEHVKLFSIGKSFEGRDIPALRVGRPGGAVAKGPRKTLVVTAGLHAREWISTTTANYVAWGLITEFNNDALITEFLENFDVVFIPSLNPDGMNYSWQTDRLWRKSRQNTGMRLCKGFDLDRSFGFGENSEHLVNDPCSEDYGGERPFEATETVALADWARNEKANNNVQFVGLVDFHSYSQQILFPYAHTCNIEPPNLENLEELATGMAKTIRLTSGESYSISPACDAAMIASKEDAGGARTRVNEGTGSIIDWFYREMGARFSYQIKLRDHGLYGFLLPEEEIIPTGQEMFNMIKYMADYLLGNNGIDRVKTAKEDANAEGARMEDKVMMRSQELRRRRIRR